VRLMYDAADPAAIPAGAPMIAGYEHGWPGWLNPYTDTVTLRPAQAPRILWVDNTGATPLTSDILDVESGAATPAAAAAWLRARRARDWWSALYVSRAGAAALVDAAGDPAAMQYVLWVADWSLDQDQAGQLTGQRIAGAEIVAVQYASPSSNGLPGYDLSVVSDSWFPADASAPAPPQVTLRAVTVTLQVGGQTRQLGLGQ
jgi:hypothetical protein